jgi:hypothetical protein
MRPTHEFPDFDYDLPSIPGFEDSSWHNDICPSLTRTAADESQTLILWCDYADPAKREDENMSRYTLIRGEYGAIAGQVTLYEGDDLQAAVAAIPAPANGMAGSVFNYFIEKLGVAPADETLTELPIDSPCGQACVRSIDRYAAMIAEMDPHPQVRRPLIESAKAQVEVLWCG